jgi:hypothetical protein
LAVAEFANSLLVIPKTLSVNAALDSTDLISKLRAFHNASQTIPDKVGLKWCVSRGEGILWESDKGWKLSFVETCDLEVVVTRGVYPYQINP